MGFSKLQFSHVLVCFQGFEYSRSGNPTRNCLEKAVAALDGAKYCEYAALHHTENSCDICSLPMQALLWPLVWQQR